MNFVRKLQSPVALVAQGFLVGGLLVSALNPTLFSRDAARADARATAAVQALIR
jgi:hypothetical protein